MPPPITPRTRRVVLALLTAAYTLSFIDRQIVAILLDDIKADIGASDGDMGFLIGSTFAIFYTFAGIPIARWADVGSRRTIIALGVATWSVCTALQAAARTFVPLSLARVGVGVGEAALSPPAHSLLTDLYPPHRRNTAMAIYATGIYLGILLAYQLGGGLGDAVGWRMTLVWVGLPGVLLAVAIRLAVPEPPRTVDRATHPSLARALKVLVRIRAFHACAFGAALASFAGYSVSIFTPAWFQRAHDMTKGDVGASIGWIVGFGGMFGAFAGGWLADRLARRDPRWHLRVPAVSAALTVVAWWAVMAAPSRGLAIACYVPYAICTAAYLGPVFATVQRIVAPSMRATAASLVLFVLNLIGLGLGPVVTGALSDHYAHLGPGAGLGRSLAIVGSVGLLASALFWFGSRALGAPGGNATHA